MLRVITKIQRNKRNRGSTLLSVVGAVMAATVSLLVYFTAERSNGRVLTSGDETFRAYATVTELLEFFRSFTGEQLKEYLKTNPVDQKRRSGLGAYPLCAHINLLDAGTGLIRNRHPVASLPASPLDKSKGVANRFFQVQVINAQTFVVNKAYCANTTRQLYLFGKVPQPPVLGQLPQDTETIQLAKDERFMVTVGLNWFETEESTERKRITLSTVLF